MNKTNMTKFKRLFEEQKKTLTIGDDQKLVSEDLTLTADEHIDEVDQASFDEEHFRRNEMRNRFMLKLKGIEHALKRIDEGNFGECENCGEDIEMKRLLAHPTAFLCVSCQEEEERQEVMSSHRRGVRYAEPVMS